MTTITVLTERCISSGSCVDAAPDVFEMDDDGILPDRAFDALIRRVSGVPA